MSDPDQRLRRVLRDDVPASVRELPDADREALADLVEQARRDQATSLEQAFHATLKHVPFPVRGLVRKVLLG